MISRFRLGTSVGTLALLLTTATAGPVHADGGGGTPTPTPTPEKPSGSIGIRLLEAPVNRRDDPRAYAYIVDHVNPGTTFSRKFEISNTSDEPQRLSSYPGAAVIRDHEFIPAPKPNELTHWITISQPKFVAPPHSRRTLTATICVPKRATRGERLGVIWASVSSPQSGQAGGNVAMVNRVGIRVYLDVGPGGEPRSDFRIEKLVPGRTKDGQPEVRATVRNTGERALDMGGQLWLSDGPSGLRAGPFDALGGSTVAPGDTAPVKVILDKQVPDGPWKAKLVLQSGRVKHGVTAMLTFPKKRGVWGLPAALNEPLPMALTVAGGLAGIGVLILLAVAVRRFRERADLGGA